MVLGDCCFSVAGSGGSGEREMEKLGCIFFFIGLFLRARICDCPPTNLRKLL